MPIGAIPAVGGLGSNLGVSKTADAATGTGGDSFAGLLGNAIGKLDASQASATQASQDLATGKATDVSGVVMQVERASLELQLASQVRNKLVDAYSELMRMQV
jgi:flagellar hook-basal body complex protein FliE